MNCYLCGAELGIWTAPGQNGTDQEWKRAFVVDGRARLKCADRRCCKARQVNGNTP